jgi:hypothetical protein
MNSRLTKKVVIAFLIVVNLCLLNYNLRIYQDKPVGRFNIIDPNSLYILTSRPDYKDEIILSYMNTTIGLSHNITENKLFAEMFNISKIDYFIDYTMYENIDEEINEFEISAQGGAYIISIDEFTFVYIHNASDEIFNYVDSIVDKIDVFKINCIDENLFHHSLFKKPILNLLINRCSISDKLLENLYEQMIDIYVISNDKTLIIKLKNQLLSIMELTI